MAQPQRSLGAQGLCATSSLSNCMAELQRNENNFFKSNLLSNGLRTGQSCLTSDEPASGAARKRRLLLSLPGSPEPSLTWLTMKKMTVMAAQARVMSIRNLNLKISPCLERNVTGHINRIHKTHFWF